MDMMSGDLEKAGHSFKSGSSYWVDNGIAVFSTSPQVEDDEEALKWAALQRLPTFRRLKKGLLTTPEGHANEVDVKRLGLQERKGLVERLVGVAEEGQESFLLRLKSRIDRVGISFPTIEVRFEHLNISAEAYVGSRALPTVLNYCVNLVENDTAFGSSKFGKTTLLLALAGKLGQDLKSSGSVTYNGHDMHEFVPQRRAAYISQHDVHIGELTVKETLAFSARCQGVGPRYEMIAELTRREKEANIKPDPDVDVYMKAISTEGQKETLVTDYILKILGLDTCADTLVGDELLRGISGGQKKRVRRLCGPARALFMDEISTGLDSSTTYQIVNSVKNYVHILNGTAVISLLQPAPETYELFDDIILLSDGQIVYQGPVNKFLIFLNPWALQCPERKGVADFLQEVTSRKDQEQYWKNRDEPYREELAAPLDKTKSHPAALTTKKYGVRKMELLKACFSRELLLMKRNSFVYIFKIIQLAIMALITMTVFLWTEMHRDSVADGGIYAGALFFSFVTVMFNGMSELSMTVAKLPVFYKQRDLLFFPAWAYALPTSILKIPVTFLEVSVWVFITYYVIGFDPSVERLFRQYLLFLLINQMASALNRFLAGVGRSLTWLCPVKRGYKGLVDMGAYWISPLMYGMNAILVNEFLGKSWRHVIPLLTNFKHFCSSKLNRTTRSCCFEISWILYTVILVLDGVGALIGYIFMFNICFSLSLTYLNPLGKTQAVKSEESQSNEHDEKSGKVGRSQNRGNSLIPQVSTDSGDGSTSSKPSSVRTEATTDTNHKKRGMVLPFEPHSITFDEITYSVDMPQAMKNQGVLEDKLVLLKCVSGAFRPGVLTALMGVSGAGKTTLMDVLAGRKTGGYIEGNISVSGYPKKQESFARISGYCEQNDIHSPYVTVYESLMYSAWLRLSTEINSGTRKMFVEEVMRLVELNPLRQALVGLPGESGLSTEQRKRLTIAVELVANPSVIFMDEPTSGLDARAAAIVMRAVRNTVDTGRTIVCTIHQPSIDIFEAFDELFLLKKGGQEIYVGPLGRHSCHLIKYFEGIEGVSKIKNGYNPATWMLEVTTSAKETELGIDFADVYKSSELYRRNKSLIQELSNPAPGSKDLYFPTHYPQSFFTQCMACLWKQHWSYWRNPPYNAIRLIYTTIVALMFGTMFWNLGSKVTKPQDLFNAIGSMYASVLFLCIKNAMTVQPIVAIERTVFYRERAAGMYSALAYAFAQLTIEIPYVFAQALIYGVIVYAMIGFEWTVAKFFWYLFFMFFTCVYFTFYGMMWVALTPNQHVAGISSNAFFALWNLFSGFMIPRTRIPIWWRWYYWTSPMAWTLYGLTVSQFGDIQDKLNTGETVEEFLKNYFGFKQEFIGVVAAAVVGFSLLFAFIYALAIKMLNFQRR
ncbi:pleiotropic drug resistance protein 1 [Prunus yedoensis var. nudiflora]|uniref:Pleiotropic drug resistance protein 1 n=1 Tax=Prunus yedoensis var. nudiflora TaxID=2094558 RepID=A0A314ZL63_PRUYE|nr:pleiotropic drug resistance protein 1 [Prunus yedoensis var. nudiflora]